jgi:Domain of unknown function (DUF1877)
MGMRLSLVAMKPDQLAGLSQSELSLIGLLLRSPDESSLHLDKEWHGIHFLLTGESWSSDGRYGSVIFGGGEFGPNLSYGPARVLAAEDIREIGVMLEVLSLDELRRRYDPVAMSKAQVYPDVWEREGHEALEWLLAGYLKLRDFYARAAAEGKGVLLAIL